MTEDLGLEVALLAAEVDYLEDLITRGILPPGARRGPTVPELRAGVRFAELDRIVNAAAALLVRTASPVPEAFLDGLGPYLAARAATPYAVVDELTRLDPVTVPGVPEAIAEATPQLVAQLTATAQAGALEALEEARRQGVEAIPDVDTDTEEIGDAARAQAGRIVVDPLTRLLTVAREAAARAATAPGATVRAVINAVIDATTETTR